MTRFKGYFVLSSLTLAAIAFASTEKEARADGPVGLSVSLERVGGLAYSNIKPSGGDTLSLTSFAIGGPAINPVALPRLGVDAILPFGLTLGGAVAFGYASLSDSPQNGGDSSAIHGTAWLISPRVGYRWRPIPLLDITPHLGATFADASLSEPTSDCNFDGTTGDESCTTGSASTSVFLVALSAEVVASLRITQSFNLLAGVSYDHVISASGSNGSSNGGSSTSTDSNVSGRYLGAQLWLGLGGYAF